MMCSETCFYGDGLRFECTSCSRCCRHTPGYVFLSPRDLEALGSALGLTRNDLLARYCREVSLGVATRISLKEKPDLDCVFWAEGGCTVYDSRPLQCRSFPFWSSALASREEWERTAAQCPGIGQGSLHSRAEIEGWVRRRLREGFAED